MWLNALNPINWIANRYKLLLIIHWLVEQSESVIPVIENLTKQNVGQSRTKQIRITRWWIERTNSTIPFDKEQSAARGFRCLRWSDVNVHRMTMWFGFKSIQTG